MSFYLLDHAPTNGTQWQQWVYPRRGGAKLSGTCIMHTSESALDVIGDDSGAEDVAAFIGRRTGSYGSYHDIVDSNSIVELVPFEYETWQDSETNNWAVGISAACRTTDWATMGDAKREGYYRNLAWCAADFVKYMKAAYNIDVPLKRISGAEARARKPGFCAHGDSGIARTDPGRDFDWDRFFRYTKEALTGISPHGDIITRQDEDKMIVLATNGNGEVWAGDGVTRTHVPNPHALGDMQWLINNGHLKAKTAEVINVGNIDAIGRDISGDAANNVLHRPVPWYGFNGEIPAEGRKDTTLALQLGWLDSSFTGNNRLTQEVNTAVGSVLEALKELPDVDNDTIDALKAQLEAKLNEVLGNLKVSLEVPKNEPNPS